jgi:hypothetical protein
MGLIPNRDEPAPTAAVAVAFTIFAKKPAIDWNPLRRLPFYVGRPQSTENWPCRRDRSPSGFTKLCATFTTRSDVYYAEENLTNTLRKLAKKTSNEHLSRAITNHLHETEGHVERLEPPSRTASRPASR